jgi:aminopeptidase N
MEYPGLVVTDGAWWTTPASWPDPLNDFVALHELAHQWFGILVGSNEIEAPMLDEGLAQWASLDALRKLHPTLPWPLRVLGIPNDPFDVARALGGWPAGPSSLAAVTAMRTGADLAGAAYMRPAFVLEALAREQGRMQLKDTLNAYVNAHRLMHATFADFFHAVDASYGAAFSRDTLAPALRGERNNALGELPTSPNPIRRVTSPWMPSLLQLAQVALAWLGP